MKRADASSTPIGWRVQRSEVVYESIPQARLEAPLARKKSGGEAARPEAVIALVKGPTLGRTAAEAMGAALLELAKIAPGFVTQSNRELQFPDGALGVAVQVSFEPAPGVRATQRHVGRLDAGTFGHATATVQAHRSGELDALEGVMVELLLP